MRSPCSAADLKGPGADSAALAAKFKRARLIWPPFFDAESGDEVWRSPFAGQSCPRVSRNDAMKRAAETIGHGEWWKLGGGGQCTAGFEFSL